MFTSLIFNTIPCFKPKQIDNKISNNMEKNEIKIDIPDGYEIDKEHSTFELIKFKKKQSQLPKTWEEFCNMFPLQHDEYFINDISEIRNVTKREYRAKESDRNMLPDRATAEAVLALCQLIQLRNAYNGDWVPDWFDYHQTKYVINLVEKDIVMGYRTTVGEILYFKTAELCNDFLRCFRPLIEKLKPLYGIKKGGEE